MKDDELETWLRRYRVMEPSSELRARIVADTMHVNAASGPAWLWGPAAAAALVAVWLGAHMVMAAEPIDPVRAAEVESVTEILGGGDDARAYAEYVVPAPGIGNGPLTPPEAVWPPR